MPLLHVADFAGFGCFEVDTMKEWESVLRVLANAHPTTEQACERVFAIFNTIEEKCPRLRGVAVKVLDEQRNFEVWNDGTIRFRR